MAIGKTLAIELGACNIRANAIAPGAVDGQRIEKVLAGRAKAEGKSVEDERASMISIQPLKRFVDPKTLPHYAFFWRRMPASRSQGRSCQSITARSKPHNGHSKGERIMGQLEYDGKCSIDVLGFRAFGQLRAGKMTV